MGRVYLSIVALIVACSLSTLAHAGPPKKLNYKEVQLLKDAIHYLDRVEGTIDQLTKETQNLKPGDPTSQQNLVNWAHWRDESKKHLGYAETRLKQLPAEHPEVAPELQRYAKLGTSLEAAGGKIDAIKGGVDKVAAQGSGSEYKADFDRLEAINQMFGNPQVLQTRPEEAIEIAKQMAPVKEERARIAAKYADLLKLDTAESKRMHDVLNYFDHQFGKFDKAAQDYAASAPAEIEASFAGIIETAKTGIANQAPAYFGPEGGVNQRFNETQTRIDVFGAISPTDPKVESYRQRMVATRSEVAKMAETLNESIVANNPMPQEVYNESDKDALIGIIKQKWSGSGNSSEVLKMGINSNGWKRENRWDWSSTSKSWSQVDKSRIQGFVLVKLDDKTAGGYYINLVKDHLSGDRIEAYFFNEPKEPLSVQYKVLLSKVK